MNICIIGGGASSFVCAINAVQKGNTVTILEKNSSPLKKVLITGAGRCNYFNSDMNIEHYRSSNKELLELIINEENIEKAKEFFKNIGVVPKIKNGYYYPYSNTATTMKNLLLVKAKELGVDIINDVTVTEIIKNDKFILKTNGKDIVCDKLVVATGSVASIKNDEYNGYKLVEKLGHNIVKPVPALVALSGNEKYFKNWAGIRCDAIVSQYENNKFVRTEEGEIQLTNYGISGICVMNLSGTISRGLEKGNKEEVHINFVPFVDKEKGLEFLENRNKEHKNLTIIELLESIINYKLLYVVLKKCGIDTNKKWNELNSEEKNSLVQNIFDFKLKITGTQGFKNAQVVSGGVPLTELTDTLESRFVKDMYMTGELIDVDGDCGGYNLGFAWITGMIVGDNI